VGIGDICLLRMWTLCLAAMLTCLCASTVPLSRPVFKQDAYIWQRQWTPTLTDAIKTSNDVVNGWRVLAAETDADGTLRPVQVDWALLISSGKPITAVVRVDGQLGSWDPDSLIAEIKVLVSKLNGAGVILAGLEMDHDCATSRLPRYVTFIQALRLAFPAIHLSITALPAWMDSSDLDDLLSQVDEVVLQVHAVRDPHSGLFDSDMAQRWIDRFSTRTHRSFRVALPTYGVRVTWGKRGEIAVVESEMPRFSDGPDADELMASPREVAALLGALRQERLPNLAGVVWFRLPTDADSRAWSLATWRAVVRGELPRPTVSVGLRESATPGMSDVVLDNPDAVDAELPREVALPAGCTEADGINGYSLEQDQAGLTLTRLQPGLLHGHHQRLIGWARCIVFKEAFDAHL
jgi:hypothetical protein